MYHKSSYKRVGEWFLEILSFTLNSIKKQKKKTSTLYISFEERTKYGLAKFLRKNTPEIRQPCAFLRAGAIQLFSTPQSTLKLHARHHRIASHSSLRHTHHRQHVSSVLSACYLPTYSPSLTNKPARRTYRSSPGFAKIDPKRKMGERKGRIGWRVEIVGMTLTGVIHTFRF